jgi:hypothetical protein
MPALTHMRPSAPFAIAAKTAIRLARLSHPRNAGARDHIRSPAKTAITPACLVGASGGRPCADSRKAARTAILRSGPSEPLRGTDHPNGSEVGPKRAPLFLTLCQLCALCVLCGERTLVSAERRMLMCQVPMNSARKMVAHHKKAAKNGNLHDTHPRGAHVSLTPHLCVNSAPFAHSALNVPLSPSGILAFSRI